jgi:hypothetical protein
MATSKKNKPSTPKPAQTFRAGSVRAAVWENMGESGPFYSASLSRSFRDAAGNWRNANTYGERQLEDLMNAALEAKEWMASHRHLST